MTSNRDNLATTDSIELNIEDPSDEPLIQEDFSHHSIPKSITKDAPEENKLVTNPPIDPTQTSARNRVSKAFIFDEL